MEAFQIIPPSSALASYIRYYWILETDRVFDTPERIIPYGNIQLSFYSGAPIRCQDHLLESQALLCGQTTGFADLLPAGRIRIISVVFRPFGARAFFRIPMDEVAGLKVNAGELGDKKFRELEERVVHTTDAQECIRDIEHFFVERFCPFEDYNYRRLSAAIHLIDQAKGNVRIAALAGESCLSSKQFTRIFSGYVGITPKDFLRTVRFQFALYLLQHKSDMNFSQLAYECGYYDQSHLINEFKIFSGYTPGEFIACCPPYSDYFS